MAKSDFDIEEPQYNANTNINNNYTSNDFNNMNGNVNANMNTNTNTNYNGMNNVNGFANNFANVNNISNSNNYYSNNNVNNNVDNNYNNSNGVNNYYYDANNVNNPNTNNLNNYNNSNGVNNYYYDANNVNNPNTNNLNNYNNPNGVNNYYYDANNVNNPNTNNPNYYTQGTYLNNADVVFEDKVYLTPEEKVKDFVGGLNKKLLLFIGGVILAILIIILIIVLVISSVNSSYKAKVIVPDIVYMGETANVSVVSQGKKNLDQTKTKFSVSTINNSKDSDKKVVLRNSFSILNDEMKGKEITNSIVPIQEGISKLSVKSTLGKRKLANVEKEVAVCPSFDSNLLLFKTISLVKDTKHDLKIDFGEEICGRGVTYESSDAEVFTVSEKGQISALKVGKAILTIKKGSREISVNVEITEKTVGMTSFSVDPAKVQLQAGENVRLKIDYAPSNATSGSIMFRSSDDSVATVSDGGLVKAVGSGTTTISISAAPGNMRKDVTVVVTGGNVEVDGTEPTEITLNKSEINIIQGNTEKVLATVTPDAAKNKTLTWKSSDENIVTVDKNGVILARAEGTANVNVTTVNNISKTIKVNVIKMNEPVITASDKILSNRWHTKAYAINFTGAASGHVYYYGTSEDKITSSGNKVTISKDGVNTYYVKDCTVSCQENCKDKKVNGKIVKDDDGNVVKECKSDCNPKPVVCSAPVAYVSKLDTTKPQVLAVVGMENHAVKDDTVQIAFKDATSLVKQWCITNVDSASTCKWKNIQTMSNPVVNYTATYNDTYYVFAKDSAGNVSNGYKFDITNIE